ncbi:Bifunctional hemolysin/adenylate cyclase precursor [Grimontia celer]|uniref:Bifunctional hemolysin/adenylate cyclase n=1 Tax=Grimontia celer TaxID=1796497 RepID=A0A128EZ21_9GAMM|nr:alkaline phosphatase [Grimontia celer]CZF79823.1 Bifunctional hemolysin/adenylate cyclase precursor [Grimontia celer]
MTNIINGTENDDDLRGDTAADTVDTIYGKGGNDTLRGYRDNDFLYGEDGDDTLYGGKGNDELHGGIGNDWLRGGSGIDFLYGGEGEDMLEGGLDNDILDGGAGNDRLFGNDGNDVISAGAGEDMVNGGKGNDTINGGDDRDILFGSFGDDTLNGNAGNDVIYGEGDNDTVYGQEGDDAVYGGLGDDKVYGGVGNDLVRGGSGNDTLYGEAGNDTIEGGLGQDTLYGGDGEDKLSGNDGDDTLHSGAGNDKSRGGNGNDTVNGGTGNDILFGDGGDDTINGDEGNDVLWGGNGIDTIKGGVDDDSLWGQVGDDLLYGQDGNDSARGGDGNDYIDGGIGNDQLFGGDGDDHLVGDDGTDPTIETGTESAAGFSIRAGGSAVKSGVEAGGTTTTISIDGVPYVVSTHWAYAGTVVVSRVESDGSLTETDRMIYDNTTGSVSTSSSGDIADDAAALGIPVGAFGNGLTNSNIYDVDGSPTLFLTSQNSGSITAWDIGSDGTITLKGGLNFGNSQTGIVRENVVFEAQDGQEYIYAARAQNDRVDILTYDSSTGAIAETGRSVSSGNAPTGLDLVNINGNDFLVSSTSDAVSIYAIDATTGGLTLTDSESVTGLGWYNSVDIYEKPDGSTYAIVDGQPGEGQVYVFELGADGSMTLTDTIDGYGSRYSSAGYVEGEPVFVMANATEGVDLYTISDDGTLVFQTHIADIENDVTTPVIVQTEDGSYFLVDADGDTASVKLDTNDFYNRKLNDYLDGQDGNDKLEGGIGDDTLKGGLDNDKLYGGEGNDYLVGDDGKAPTLTLSASSTVIEGPQVASATTTSISVDGVAYVVSTQWAVSGLAIVYRVENDGSLTETDRMTYDSSTLSITTTSSGDISAAIADAGVPIGAFGNGLTQSNIYNVDGTPTLFMTSQNSGSITAWHIAEDGTFSFEGGLRFGHSQTHLNGGIVRENVVYEALDGQEYIYAARAQNDRIDILTYDSETGTIAETGNTVATGDWGTGLDLVTLNANTYLVSSGSDKLSIFAVDPNNGGLSLVSEAALPNIGTYNGVDVYETTDGRAYAIVDGSPGDSDIFVFEIGSDGALTLTDTIEGYGSRYSSAGYVEGEPVFTMINATEGVDLYTISDQGKLEFQLHISGIENDVTTPVIVQTEDGSYYLVDADGNTATVKLDFSYDKGNTEDRTHNDELYGGSGDDRLEGNYGDDILDGGTGQDRLNGGIGDDFLNGGAGRDTLTGGLGADKFFFDSNSGSDTVTDFNASHDILVIDSSLATSLAELNIKQSGTNTLISNSDESVFIKLEEFDADSIHTDLFDFT